MKENITSKQMVALITLTRLSTALSIMPTTNIRPNNQDIWVMILVSIAYTIIFMLPLLFLANKFRDSTMIGYFQVIYGKPFGKTIGVIYGIYFLTNSFNTATIQSELLTTAILTDSPENLVILVMLVTAIYCVSKGMVNGLRSIELIAPVSITIVIILLAFGVNNFQYRLLLPILSDSSFLDINLGAMELSTFFQEIFFLTMCVPYLENKNDINKILVKSVIYSIGLLSIIIIVSFITFGVEFVKHSNFPFLLYARSIDILAVVERIDSIAVLAWIVASSSRISAFLGISVNAIREVFNRDENDIVIFGILSLILSIVSLYTSNSRSVIISREDLYRLKYILFIVFVITIPSITSLVYLIRRKTIEGKNTSS